MRHLLNAMDLTAGLHSTNEEEICDATVSSSDEPSFKEKSSVPKLKPKEQNMPDINARTLCTLDQIGIPSSWTDDQPCTSPNRCVLDYLPLLPAPATFSEMSQLDSQAKSAKPGVTGLRNLGNTCFMNSGLQCLLNNPSLVHFFLESFEADESSKETLSAQFSQLMSKVWSGQYPCLKPVEFKEALGQWHPQFRDYRQHDCQEFLALLLDTLHEQLNTSCNNTKVTNSTVREKLPEDPHMEDDQEDELLNMKDDSKTTDVKELAPSASSDNSNSTSPHSTDSFGSWDASSSFRMYPVPEDVKPFGDVTAPKDSNLKENCETPNNNGKTCSNLIPLESLTNRGGSLVKKNPIDSSVDNSFVKNQLVSSTIRKLPTIEDFVKETKTLNTNVLVSEEANNLLKFDSEKFPKTEPPLRPRETLDNLSHLMAIDAPCNSKQQNVVAGSLKRIKETNVLQDRKDNCASSSVVLISKRMKIDNDMGEDSGQSNQSESVEELEAESEWAKYQAKNQSIIVDTFQGQFRSTVKCSECGHVSVTYEPFMYLPVPLPYALERQIVITFVPKEGKFLMRYLLTVHKNDKVYKLKDCLMAALIEDGNTVPEDIVFAEVFDNHISRILEGNVLMRYVNDTNRDVYAFEVYSTNNLDYDASILPDLSHEDMQRKPIWSEDMEERKDQAETSSALGVGGNCRQDFQPLLDGTGDHCVSSSSGIALLPHWSGLENEETSTLSISESLFSSDDITSTTRDLGPSTSSDFCHEPLASTSCLGDVSTELSLYRGPQMEPWHSCAICLEEMPDVQLRTHPPCQCLLCHTCIEISFKHYGAGLICPVCGVPVRSEDEFVPVLKLDNFKAKIRFIFVPVVFRLCESGQLKLIGHPTVLRVPDNLPASMLYECIDKCVPFLAPYSLFFVDGQGKNCSRCVYTRKCSGCEVSRYGDISLQVGDNLAITFDALANDFPIEESVMTTVENHKSMMNKRVTKEPLTLYDCLKAFSESETLDEQNPWYCPVCQCHRQARKSLSVWRCPDTLMVYLKRFMFHEFSSTKVDDKVLFPLEGLDLSPFISGPKKDHMPYNLQACVCHFGGVSSGHYTSYSKHTISGEWNYYNDDSTREQKPQDEDHVHAYILFYQRPGSLPNPSLPKTAEGIIFEKSDMSPDDGSCSSLGLKPDTISHILSQLEDCNEEGTKQPEGSS